MLRGRLASANQPEMLTAELYPALLKSALAGQNGTYVNRKRFLGDAPTPSGPTMRRFHVGDIVAFGPGKGRSSPAGPFEVVACLPREDNTLDCYSYRIKSAAEATERVAQETQLTAYN